MSTLLKQYLNASTEEYSDGEQTLDAPTKPKADVHQEMAEMAEAELRQDEIVRDTEVLVESQEAMEQYHALLTQALEDGGVNAQAAAFLRVGIERYEEKLGIEGGLTPSVESFGGSASRMRSTHATLESVSEFLKKSWEVLKKMLQTLIQTVKDVYQKVTVGAYRVEVRADQVMRQARGVKGEPSHESLTLPTPTKLWADGEFVEPGDPVVTGVIHYMTEIYPNEVIAYVNKAAEVVRTMDVTKPDEAAAKLINLHGVMAKFPGKAVPANDKRFAEGVIASKTETLPGNMALYLSHPKDKGDEKDALQSLRRLQSDLRVEMLPVPGAKDAPAEYEYKVPTPQKLAEHAGKISKAAEQIKKTGQHDRAIKKAIDGLIKAGEKLDTMAHEEDLDASQRATVDAIFRGLVAIQHLLGKSINGALSFSVRTLHAQLKVVETSLSLYTGTK